MRAENFNFVVSTVSKSTGIAPTQIVSANKGAPYVARCRALVAYILSTEMQLTDAQIGKLLSRDRSTVSHAVTVIENLREITDFDNWLDDFTGKAFNPPPMPQELKRLFETEQERDLLRVGYKPHNVQLPPKVKAIAERVAQIHQISLCDIMKHKEARNQTIIEAAQIKGYCGNRLYSARRLAPYFRLSHNAVATIIRGVANNG